MILNWTFELTYGDGIEVEDITDVIEELGLEWEKAYELSEGIVGVTVIGFFQEMVEFIYLYNDYKDVEFYVAEMLKESGVFDLLN